MKQKVNLALRAKRKERFFSGFTLNVDKVKQRRSLRYVVMLLCLLTLGIGEMSGSSSYYAKLTASSSDEARGKVYVATSETAYGDRVYAASSNAKSEDIGSGATQTFYIYAEAVRGYKFTGWTKTDSKTHSIADASAAETTDGVVANTKDGTTEYTIQASFVENTNKFNIRYLASTHGTYTVKGPTGYPSVTVPSGDIETYDNDNITLTATPASGYSIKRFFIQDANGIKETIGERGEKIQTVNIPDYAVAVGAEFKVASPFKVGDETYATLSDALQAVGTSGTIRVVEDATVAAGYYTIPAGVTLIVPRYAEQTEIEEHPERVYNAWTKPSPFRTLTLASGVHIDVYGTVFTASLMAAKGQTNGYNGMPHGKYGHIVMNAGSTMTLNNGSQLYCWGYITGAGTIDARRGSTTHEFIQLRDWRGGSATSYGTWNKVFPFNQYYIQNIEVPVTYRPGSLAKADGTVNASSAAQPFNDVNVIGVEGSKSLFMMDANDDSEDTWVRKSYNKTTDQQIYEINSSAKLSSLVVYGMSSSSYVLPITSNMKIHVLSGSMNITENTELLPGSEIEIDKEASCEVASGKSLYIFDSENWSGHSSGTYYVPYSPSWTTCPRSGVKDAQVNVHGTVRANGTIYTTEKGANVFSSNDDAGTYYFAVAAPTGNSTVEYANGTNYKESSFRTSVTVNPAKLKNGNGSYTETVNTPAGKSFAYIEDEWKLYDVDPDNSCFIYDEEGTYYAKPKGYVAINATKSGTVISGNPDHTFSDKAGTGRLFILMDGCQWWEVVLSGDLYYCADNDIYYTYNTSTNKWEEKTYTILWKDWDGTTLTTYTGVKRGTMATYNSSNPTRANTLDEIYSFGGWSPTPATVTGDATYTATYSCTIRKYTIQFLSDRGTEIDRQQLARGEIPALPEAPQKPGKYLVWNPTIAAVTGDQIYRATYLDNEPDEFTVTWHQYDGSEIYHETVSKDAIPNYDVATYGTPVKDLGNEYIYTFTGWSPVVAAATENVSYTASFSAAKKTYTVTFRDENGNALGAAYGTGSYEIGQTPTSSYVPAQPNPEQYNYTFTWSPAIETVTADATYTAHLDRTTRKYTILANGIHGTALGGGTHNYGVSIPLTAVPNDYYHFIKWQKNGVDVVAGDGGTASPLEITVTGDATYTAVAEANTFSVSFAAGAQGSGTMSNQAFTCYVAQNLTSNAFTGITKTVTYDYHGATAGNGTASASDSYTFANWLCTEDSRTYTNGQNVSNLTSTNGAIYALTAQWTAPSVTLPTPTRIGYTFNGWYDAATGGTKVGDAGATYTLSADITLHAQWIANTNTAYTVKHYQENPEDNEYTLFETQNLAGTTNTEVTPAVMNYTGFTAPATQTKTIAADGSMEISYYYTRNTYTITWVDGNGTTIETDENVKYGAIPTYDGVTPTKTATAQYTYTFDDWDADIVPVTGNATYTATFTSTVNTYTITFNNWNGAELQSSSFAYGQMPAYNGTTPNRPADASYNYTFTGWTPEIVTVTGPATYTAQYAAVEPDLIVNEAYSLPGTVSVSTTTVTTTGTLTVPSGKTLTTTDLILEATTSASGQLFINNNVTVTGNAYFDLTLNAQTRTWYGVGVPWRVNAQYDIYGDGKHLVLGKDFDIIWYSGEMRATAGPVNECYKYLEDIGNPDNRIVEPGRMYFMYFARPYNVIRFAKLAGAALVNEGNVQVDRFEDNRTDKTNWNWNGIANPGLTHVTIPQASPNAGYRYKNVNIDENRTNQWELVTELNTKTFVVGQPIMVQVPGTDENKAINLNMVRATVSSAPLRKMAANGDIDRAEVLLTSANGLTDRILCVVNDEAKDEYTLGQDLVKFTNGAELPQMWINNYKHALAVNTIRLENSIATYPLTIVSPKAGDYTLSLVNKLADGIHLYLTLNGEAIADLTEGAYTLPMGKETNKAYGLRLVRGPRGTVTDIDEALEGKDNAEKVVMDGVLYIIRQGKVYDAQGHLIDVQNK